MYMCFLLHVLWKIYWKIICELLPIFGLTIYIKIYKICNEKAHILRNVRRMTKCTHWDVNEGRTGKWWVRIFFTGTLKIHYSNVLANPLFCSVSARMICSSKDLIPNSVKQCPKQPPEEFPVFLLWHLTVSSIVVLGSTNTKMLQNEMEHDHEVASEFMSPHVIDQTVCHDEYTHGKCNTTQPLMQGVSQAHFEATSGIHTPFCSAASWPQQAHNPLFIKSWTSLYEDPCSTQYTLTVRMLVYFLFTTKLTPTMDKVIRAKEWTYFAGSYTVHGSRLQIHQDSTRNILVGCNKKKPFRAKLLEHIQYLRDTSLLLTLPFLNSVILLAHGEAI